MIWNEKMECMSREDMRAIQSERLVNLVKYVYDNVEFYRNRLDEQGVKPEECHISRKVHRNRPHLRKKSL